MPKYFKFIKDHPISGGKEGEIQVAQGKIPPHLLDFGYVKEIKKEEYDKFLRAQQENEDNELQKRIKAQMKEAKAQEQEESVEVDSTSVSQTTPKETNTSKRNAKPS